VYVVVLSGGSKDSSGSVYSLLVGFSLIFFFRNPKIFFENRIQMTVFRDFMPCETNWYSSVIEIIFIGLIN